MLFLPQNKNFLLKILGGRKKEEVLK